MNTALNMSHGLLCFAKAGSIMAVGLGEPDMRAICDKTPFDPRIRMGKSQSLVLVVIAIIGLMPSSGGLRRTGSLPPRLPPGPGGCWAPVRWGGARNSLANLSSP